jgi:hypothetical protein
MLTSREKTAWSSFLGSKGGYAVFKSLGSLLLFVVVVYLFLRWAPQNAHPETMLPLLTIPSPSSHSWA